MGLKSFVESQNPATKNPQRRFSNARYDTVRSAARTLGRFGFQGESSRHLSQYSHYKGYTYSIVRTIATRIAGQPIQVGRRHKPGQTGRGKAPNKNHVPTFLKGTSGNAASVSIYEDHPILDTLRNPNPIMVSSLAMYTTVASLHITGKAFWWLVIDEMTGQPQIWPLPSHWMEPIHTDTKLFAEWRIQPDTAPQFRVSNEDIVYFYTPDISDPLAAYSPADALARTISVDENTEEAQRRAMMNTIHPSHAIIVGRDPSSSPIGVGGANDAPVMTRAQRKQFRQILTDEYVGAMNAGKPMIMDGFIRDVKSLQQGSREVDYLNSSIEVKNRLAQGFSTNPIVMGQYESANRASSSVADEHFVKNAINPCINMMSEVMSAQLPPWFAKHVRSDTTRTTPFRGGVGGNDEVVYIEPAHASDADYELQFEQFMLANGGMSINEILEAHGRAPIVGGDVGYMGGQPVAVVKIADGKADGKSFVRPKMPIPETTPGGVPIPKPGTGGQATDKEDDEDNQDDGEDKPFDLDAIFGPSKRRRGFRLKVVDDSGHEHGPDGRFGSGGHGGGASAKPHGRNGSVDEGTEAHEQKASGYMDKLKAAGAGAVAVGKRAAQKAITYAMLATEKLVMSNAADAILDNADDWGMITNSHMVKEQLGMGGQMAMKIGTAVVGYAFAKLRAAVAAKRAAAKYFKSADVSETPEEQADIILGILNAIFVEGAGADESVLPTKDQIVAKIHQDSDDQPDGNKNYGGATMASRMREKGVAALWVKRLDDHAAEMTEIVAHVLKSLGSQVVDQVEKDPNMSPHMVASLIDPTEWANRLKGACIPMMRRAALESAALEMELYANPSKATQGGLPGRIVHGITAFIQKVASAGFWTKIGRTIRSSVIKAGDAALEAGTSVVNAIKDILVNPHKIAEKAGQINENESTSAVSAGRHAVQIHLEEIGVIKGRKWVTTLDGRERDSHHKANDQVVYGDSPFTVGGVKCQFPGDPNLPAKERCGCRCVVVSVQR